MHVHSSGNMGHGWIQDPTKRKEYMCEGVCAGGGGGGLNVAIVKRFSIIE